ncbi:MAG: hypothetical protein JRI83_07910 [Deltaproteobacteria bacterium]|nr:hypothetical protein [Deltaproteobacteria bacterium]
MDPDRVHKMKLFINSCDVMARPGPGLHESPGLVVILGLSIHPAEDDGNRFIHKVQGHGAKGIIIQGNKYIRAEGADRFQGNTGLFVDELRGIVFSFCVHEIAPDLQVFPVLESGVSECTDNPVMLGLPADMA